MSHTSPKNQRALQHNAPRPQPRQATPGDLLFEFVRMSDRKLFRCELRFHANTWPVVDLNRRSRTRGATVKAVNTPPPASAAEIARPRRSRLRAKSSRKIR